MPNLRRLRPTHGTRTWISKTLRDAVWTTDKPLYVIAREIPLHPSTLSGWLNGIYPVQKGDPRVIRLGALVGVSAHECFEQPPPRVDLCRAKQRRPRDRVRRISTETPP